MAQILDYVSWITELDTPEVYSLAESYFINRETSFSKEFFGRFQCSIPEPLNQAHSLVIVASSLDPASSRIVEYLGLHHEVGINTAFFNVFELDGHQIVAADWQMDQEEVVERTQRRIRAPWSGTFYVNVGDGPSRSWEDMCKYGSISAGGGSIYSQKLYQLSEGDVFYAYQRQSGYVGKGEVISKAKPARDIEIDGKSLLEHPLVQPNISHDSDNTELSEHVVRVKWYKTLPILGAQTFSGAFANQNVVCKLRDQATLDFLEKAF